MRCLERHTNLGRRGSKESNHPKNTVFDVKRLMGTRFSDGIVQKDIESWPFKVIEGPGDKPMIEFEHELEVRFSPEEISAMILKNLKEAAEAYLGTTVTDAPFPHILVTSNDRQPKMLAGLNVIRLINEPTSAAIAYGLDKSADINCRKMFSSLI